MIRIFIASFAMLLMSGCCEVFGICTSVSVHTSATPTTKTANLNIQQNSAQTCKAYD
jgi:hypothetical protein